jgi:UDP-glucuronate 4-epimerase
MRILVTGAAGFIGYHLSKKLLLEGYEVLAVDNINDYYDPQLKLDRLQDLGIKTSEISNDLISINSEIFKSLVFVKANIEDKNLWDLVLAKNNVDCVIHLAAQAGVRYSLENPKAYVKSNVEGFLNVLEYCREAGIKELIYASSSSVYGLDSKQPFSEEENCDKPISLYAATKRSNELMAYTYSHLFGINSIGLRFFTVYGPWGRPDMAPFLFTKAAFDNKPIDVYNNGLQKRDFTYIDDIIGGIVNVLDRLADVRGAIVSNIGQGNPVDLLEFIEIIEKETGVELIKIFKDSQPGDVVVTYADTSFLGKNFGYKPSTNLKDGIRKFTKWYREYYN